MLKKSSRYKIQQEAHGGGKKNSEKFDLLGKKNANGKRSVNTSSWKKSPAAATIAIILEGEIKRGDLL